MGQNSHRLWIGCTLLLGISAVLPACAVYKVQTDGYQSSASHEGTTVVVWGTSPSIHGTATTWLQKRGLIVVERARLQAMFEEQRIHLTHTPDDETQLLQVGQLVGADMVMFAEGAVLSGQAGNASVSVRGVDVESGTVQWSGIARYSGMLAYLDLALSGLTCEALATAWGFRKPGTHFVAESSICMTP